VAKLLSLGKMVLPKEGKAVGEKENVPKGRKAWMDDERRTHSGLLSAGSGQHKRQEDDCRGQGEV